MPIPNCVKNCVMPPNLRPIPIQALDGPLATAPTQISCRIWSSPRVDDVVHLTITSEKPLLTSTPKVSLQVSLRPSSEGSHSDEERASENLLAAESQQSFQRGHHRSSSSLLKIGAATPFRQLEDGSRSKLAPGRVRGKRARATTLRFRPPRRRAERTTQHHMIFLKNHATLIPVPCFPNSTVP